MKSSVEELKSLQQDIHQFITQLATNDKPASLYEPIRYVLHASGKRIRPILTLIAAKMGGGTTQQILPIACTVEVFHNFTLVHDDIMDHADERRGNLTVHKKWDENVAILSGDMMVGMSYRLLSESGSPYLKEILKIFNDGVDAVCEGQALDKEFEVAQYVKIPDYLDMIEKKTGWLIATALEIGYVAVNGLTKESNAFRELGLLLGRGFQIQDDYLDLMADQQTFGKRIGGDIVEGKKTYLLLTAAELATGNDAMFINDIMNKKIGFDQIEKVRELFKKLGVLERTEKLINQTFDETAQHLQQFEKMPHYNLLKTQIELILNRKF